MKTFLYRIGIFLYRSGIAIASPFHEKARNWVRGRKDLFRSLKARTKELGTGKRVWVHASSLGEFEQGRPVIEGLKEKDPDLRLILSFFSPSGYLQKKDYEKADIVTYIPLDTPKNAQRFISILQPDLAIFVKYDLWYYHLRELKKNSIPTLLISAVFRENHRYFRSGNSLFAEMLQMFTKIHVQDERSRSLLSTIGVENVEVSGDTRIDRVASIATLPEPDPAIEEFKGDGLLLVVGSSWPPEEKMLANILPQLIDQYPLKVLLAPHDVNQEHLNRIKGWFQDIPLTFHSTYKGTETPSNTRLMVMDRIGLLKRSYYHGEIAIIGGGFGAGIHNLLEPAAFGLPILFGPNHHKFPEAKALLDNGGGTVFKDQHELKRTLDSLLQNEEELESKGKASYRFIKEHKGASEKVIEEAMRLIGNKRDKR